MVQKIDMLLKNKWEKYDAEKMRKKKAIIVSVLFAIIWFLLLLLFYMVFRDVKESAGLSTVFLVVIGAVIFIKLKQMDAEKNGWYFSALQDRHLKREEVLGILRDFLKSHGYAFHEEETHRTVTLWITYFTIPAVDFRLRLWFTTLNGIPVAEVGIGPETPPNRELLKELRDEISSEFIKRYQTGSPPLTS